MYILHSPLYDLSMNSELVIIRKFDNRPSSYEGEEGIKENILVLTPY